MEGWGFLGLRHILSHLDRNGEVRVNIRQGLQRFEAFEVHAAHHFCNVGVQGQRSKTALGNDKRGRFQVFCDGVGNPCVMRANYLSKKRGIQALYVSIT